MKLNESVLSALSSRPKIKVLGLLAKQGFSATGREMGRLSGISQTMAIRILKEFEGKKIAKSSKAGKSIMWSGDHGSFAFDKLAALLRDKKSHIPVEHFKEMIKNKLNMSGIKNAILFGSVADGKEKQTSDIDLFICVKDNAAREKAENICRQISHECIRLYGNPLREYILTEKEYETPKNTKLIDNIHRGVKLI